MFQESACAVDFRGLRKQLFEIDLASVQELLGGHRQIKLVDGQLGAANRISSHNPSFQRQGKGMAVGIEHGLGRPGIERFCIQ